MKRGRVTIVATAVAVVSMLLLSRGLGFLEHTHARPPTANAPAPARINNLMSALAQTSAVVEGTVTNIEYTYSDEEGPWTIATLSSLTTHVGQKVPDQLLIRQYGGPRPNGRFLVVSDHVRFLSGARYVVFLRNTSWNLSPVLGDLALRVENVNGKELLINGNGQPLTGVDGLGFSFAAALETSDADLQGHPALDPKSVVPAVAASALNRQALVAALRNEVSVRRLAVGGEFFDVPAGRTRFQRTSVTSASGTALTPDEAAADSAPSTPEPGENVTQ